MDELRGLRPEHFKQSVASLSRATLRGLRTVVARQIKHEWDYLYGALSVSGGEAHFAPVPGVSLEWDEACLRDLAASDGEAIHIMIRDRIPSA